MQEEKQSDINFLPKAESRTPRSARVVILGRTNVGKSTLFNKLAESYQAMVSRVAGTTRDIKKSIINWQGAKFELIDTGGLSSIHLTRNKKQPACRRGRETRNKNKENLNFKIIQKALEAVKEADLILFIVDAKDGLLKEDKEIAGWLKKHNLNIILVANKSDNLKLRQASSEFYKLGLGEPLVVSAASGSGTGDLLDIIIRLIKSISLISDKQPAAPPSQASADFKERIKVSIIGRPNVGKSSLLNKLIGEERVIVSPTPHTTREPIDTVINYKNYEIILIDTAGIRRKAKISLKSLEKQGVKLSFTALEKSDIAILVIDPSDNIGQQDLKLAKLAQDARVGIIIVVNKIDLLSQSNLGGDKGWVELEKAIKKTFNFINWSPIILTSALTGKNVHKIFDLILDVNKNHSREINQEKLDELRKKLVAKHTPPRKRTLGRKGTRAAKIKKSPKIAYLKQIEIKPPHFEIIYRGVGILPLTYLKYFEKGLRENFDFSGTPIIIHQRKV